MSEIKVNKISPRAACGTVQLGDSGDTITIPAGATITNAGTANGFGATGAVNWQTSSIKTTTFTAANGEGYFVNTTSGAVTANLPAGTAGAIVAFKDYAKTFDSTNKLTLVQNGSDKVGGSTINPEVTTAGIAITLVFVDSTQGWLITDDGLQPEAATAQFISASGGTETTSGNFKIHTFTGPGTFTVSSVGNACGSDKVDYLVVAGGGGGGGDAGGGGGAGGFRLANHTCMPAPQTSPLANASGLPVSATGYPITVGGGGAGHSGPATPPAQKGTAGNPSVFSTITSTAGGGGGQSNAVSGQADAGGSGGGGRGSAPAGGAGNTPPVAPPQGNPGGNGPAGGAGGGGASAAGSPAGPSSPTPGGNGGAGSFVVASGFAGCNGTPGPVSGARYFAGGGGGSADQPGPAAGVGGDGGGGPGQQRPSSSPGVNGTANTGGGGGGGAVPSTGSNGGTGGSGIVIIRYKYQ